MRILETQAVQQAEWNWHGRVWFDPCPWRRHCCPSMRAGLQVKASKGLHMRAYLVGVFPNHHLSGRRRSAVYGERQDEAEAD
jgi:hypothetical protein